VIWLSRKCRSLDVSQPYGTKSVQWLDDVLVSRFDSLRQSEWLWGSLTDRCRELWSGGRGRVGTQLHLRLKLRIRETCHTSYFPYVPVMSDLIEHRNKYWPRASSIYLEISVFWDLAQKSVVSIFRAEFSYFYKRTDGGDGFLWNSGTHLPYYITSRPRISSFLCSPVWEPHNLYSSPSKTRMIHARHVARMREKRNGIYS
jgi:hypothetical protein